MSITPSAGSVQGSTLPSSGLPVVNQTLEPAWVRNGSSATQKAYQTALAFEEMLVEQLSKSLTATSGLGGESGQEGESSSEAGAQATGASSSPLSSMLPQALTSGVMSAGGLGLAAQMTRELQGADPRVTATGGTNAAATPAVGGASTSGQVGAADGTSASGQIGTTGDTSAGSRIGTTGGTSA
jgi:Rod binding domain-containing protein